MRHFLSLVFFCSSLSLYAEQIYWLKRVSEIENPMGFWAIPQGSLDNWSRTSITISGQKSRAKFYLTYEYLPSDAPPPFTAAEYEGSIVQKEIELLRGDVSIYIEDSTKERNIAGHLRMTGCGVYQKKGAQLLAYCAPYETGIGFHLISTKDEGLGKFYSENGHWKVNITKAGPKNYNKTAILMLATLRMWRPN